MDETKITLEQMLKAREDRANRQRRLLDSYRCPLISFTMNIPGPVKTSPSIRRAFHTGLRTLESRLTGHKVLNRSLLSEPTGEEALFVVDADPVSLKQLCAELEEASPLARLFDMDVLDRQGQKLDRTQTLGLTERACMVCGAPGRFCAAGRLHTLSQLRTATNTLIRDHFAPLDSARFAALASAALLQEVETTPKPGLVDQRNNGSHKDMTLATFRTSAAALTPYFQECILIGMETALLPPSQTFPLLRKAGLKAEETMYLATAGVNTHKGAIFTLGILSGALGRLWTSGSPIPATEALLAECSRIAAPHMAPELETSLLYRQLRLTGIRGEAADGLPSVQNISLPAYKKALEKGFPENYAGAVTLLHLIANVSDTNLYRRGGVSGAAYAAAQASHLLVQTPYPSVEDLCALDDAFIDRNLSPGGCADLLAVTYFLHNLSNLSL